MTPVDVVVPTVGRARLRPLVDALVADGRPSRVVVVDDRTVLDGPLDLPDDPRVRTVRSGGVGPAAARNLGWRTATAPWVAFLDDDVELPEGWWDALVEDLAAVGPAVAGVQGRIVVPLPTDRPPTDWERNVAGLESARWATADMAWRRAALEDLAGFDERFRRAYREDADLALRARRAGWALERGRRVVRHPVGPAPWWRSVSAQRGNLDDARMRRLHGPDWRDEAEVGPGGRRPRHLAVTAALALAATGPRRLRPLAAALAGAGVAELAWARVRPGPRHAREVAAMVATSAALPPAATWWWLRGQLAARRAGPWPSTAAGP